MSKQAQHLKLHELEIYHPATTPVDWGEVYVIGEVSEYTVHYILDSELLATHSHERKKRS